MQQELLDFLIQAKKRGYAAGGESVSTTEGDGSKSTRFENGSWAFHDNWFGGEPFGGREIVHKEHKPYWMMVYYGSDTQIAPKTIPHLLEALSLMPDDFPARGPQQLEKDNYRYINEWTGDITSFTGVEKIFYNGEEVYMTTYAGGLVDQREG